MCFAQDAVGTSDDDAPSGYESTEAVKMAIFLGEVRLVDPWIDVPVGIEVRKDVQYGKGGQDTGDTCRKKSRLRNIG